MLHEVLEELDVPTSQIKYVCRGEMGPEIGLLDHVVICLRVPTSKTILELRAFTILEVERTIEACVQSVSCLAHVSCRSRASQAWTLPPSSPGFGLGSEYIEAGCSC